MVGGWTGADDVGLPAEGVTQMMVVTQSVIV